MRVEQGLRHLDSFTGQSTGAAKKPNYASQWPKRALCCKRESTYFRLFSLGANVTHLCSVSAVMCSELCTKTVPKTGARNNPKFSSAVRVQEKASVSQSEFWVLILCFDQLYTTNKKGRIPKRKLQLPFDSFPPPKRMKFSQRCCPLC